MIVLSPGVGEIMAPRRKSKPTARGDCYEAAGKFMMDSCLHGPDCTYLLVHGEEIGRAHV